MSETNQVPSELQEEASQASNSEVSSELFEVHGKKFNISTAEGKGELKGFLEAMSTELGRKANEVGTLRKFAAAVKPDSNESELLAKARAKAQAGDIDDALDQVFSYSKAKVNELKQQQAVDTENNETWDDYLSSRPDLLKVFDKKTIRQVSEATLKIHDNDDAFKLLDSFWLPKVKTVMATSSTSQTPSQAPAKTDKPLNTLSSGSVAPKGAASSGNDSKDAQKVSFDDIFDSVTRPGRFSVKAQKN